MPQPFLTPNRFAPLQSLQDLDCQTNDSPSQSNSINPPGPRSSRLMTVNHKTCKVISDSMFNGCLYLNKKKTYDLTTHPGSQPQDVLQKINVLKPDHEVKSLIIHNGTNSLVSKSYSKKHLADNIEQLLQSVSKVYPSAKIAYCGLIYRRDVSDEIVILANEEIKSRCKSLGVTFVNSNHWLTKHDLSKGGLHPSRTGASKLHNMILEIFDTLAWRPFPDTSTDQIDNTASTAHLPSLPTETHTTLITDPDNCSTTQPMRPTIIEREGSLFDLPASIPLAHCVAADLRMSKGIASCFKKKFGHHNHLVKQEKTVGSVATLHTKGQLLFYLVTKQFSYQKPCAPDLKMALKELRNFCSFYHIPKVAMPRIGCGLDGMYWPFVKNMISNIFQDSKTQIIIIHLPTPFTSPQHDNDSTTVEVELVQSPPLGDEEPTANEEDKVIISPPLPDETTLVDDKSSNLLPLVFDESTKPEADHASQSPPLADGPKSEEGQVAYLPPLADMEAAKSDEVAQLCPPADEESRSEKDAAPGPALDAILLPSPADQELSSERVNVCQSPLPADKESRSEEDGALGPALAAVQSPSPADHELISESDKVCQSPPPVDEKSRSNEDGAPGPALEAIIAAPSTNEEMLSRVDPTVPAAPQVMGRVIQGDASQAKKKTAAHLREPIGTRSARPNQTVVISTVANNPPFPLRQTRPGIP